MSGIADKIETQRKLKAKYESARKEFEVAKNAMENAQGTFETAKRSVDQTVSKLRSCTEELDLMDNVDIEKVSHGIFYSLFSLLLLLLSFFLSPGMIDFNSSTRIYR